MFPVPQYFGALIFRKASFNSGTLPIKIPIGIFDFGTGTDIYLNISVTLLEFRFRKVIFIELHNVYRNMSVLDGLGFDRLIELINAKG